MSSSPGVPYKLLCEFKNKRIGVETSSGDSFRGILIECEENMGLMLSAVKATFVDGKTMEIESVYVKGAQLRLISFPDSTKNLLPKIASDSRSGGYGHRSLVSRPPPRRY